MKIILPGGTGQLGNLLARSFHDRGDEVLVFSRHPRPTPWRQVHWDGCSQGPWARELENAFAVINLAGRSVDCRYTPVNRSEILASRIQSTRILGEAITQCSNPPRVWLQSSTATIYSHRFDAPNDEHTGILGGEERDIPDTWRFSLDVARQWERAADSTPLPQTRLARLRIAMVMSPESGGAFETLLRLVRWGLGGKVGSGRQYISWVHDSDFIRAVDWLLTHDLAGPVNVCAPNPLPQAEFMKLLRDAWGTSIGLPAHRWLLEVGTFLLRTESELILKSRRVVPTRMSDAGFDFLHSGWATAAQDLCERWRRKPSDRVQREVEEPI